MTDLDKAREWADRWSEDDPLILADAKAAIKLIKGLPDQWVDVEEVREVINGQLSVYTRGTASHYIAEEITRKLKEALIAPKLPTLADMTPEEREACQWMQAKIPDSDQIHVIANVWPTGSFLWRADGHSFHRDNALITPLPDLPKLQWPGGVVDCEIVDETPDDQSPRPEGCCGKCPETIDGGYDCTCEDNPRCSKNTPTPADVPPNELWLVEYYGDQWLAQRNRNCSDNYPWRIASTDGEGIDIAADSQITLIHKLVPETHALPEGMRLADHEEYGRVVTSPWGDGDDDYKIFFLNEDVRAGADYEYAHKSTLTFLGGDQHV